MKKILLAVALIAGVSVSSFAQKKSDDGGKFSIGLEAGLPVGDFSNLYSFAIGGSLKYAQPIADATAFTISAGYTSFKVKSALGGGTSGFVPVKAGIKYNFAEAFYGEAQVGAAFGTQSGGGTAFAYSPGIGYDFGGGVDLGVRYEGWSHNGTLSQIAARLAYSF